MKSTTDRIDTNALISWLGPAYDELTAARVTTGNDGAALIAELERLTT